ncbi:geranylgeranylglycerol-phosphate geranylgeranyltransferase [Bizionia myxarmorum]|uniref:Prenyltransferase n=1 Tax=Bizionia myxarmorum TaxID=291186 RepID=A0A5D0QZU2_9FLAO|nr:geranylgeranylglycerol-phosphate geranylgeranyltransferase [Bizionia myxarmorum]TYB74329.1 prenyltransferase [Bizionia myxarmorum]
MQSILSLIRWKNLLMIALVQLLIKYALLEPFGAIITLNGFGFSLLVLATVCIAASGYIINDIYDQETDAINKPKQQIIGKSISEKTAYNYFIGFNVIGVLLGFYISNMVGRSGFFALFVLTSGLLYIYATYLKQIPIVGTVIISFLVALSLIIVGLFELLPAITSRNQELQLFYFEIILAYALFAFLINFIRELIKDLEDIDGDYKAGIKTLPIVLGRERTNFIVFFLTFIPLFAIIFYVTTNMYKNLFIVGYFLLLVIAPLILALIWIFQAKLKKDYHAISTLLKVIMLFGMLSMVLYQYI